MWAIFVTKLNNRVTMSKLFIGFNNINNFITYGRLISICKIMNNVYLLIFGNSLINFIMTPLGNENKMNSTKSTLWSSKNPL